MTLPAFGGDTSRQVTTDLREVRAESRESDADLVPVEGGEPMPAEEPPAPARPTTF